MNDMTGGDTDPVAALRRWEQFGARWRVVADRDDRLTISLCRCDSDEEVARVVSAGAARVRRRAHQQRALTPTRAGRPRRGTDRRASARAHAAS